MNEIHSITCRKAAWYGVTGLTLLAQVALVGVALILTAAILGSEYRLIANQARWGHKRLVTTIPLALFVITVDILTLRSIFRTVLGGILCMQKVQKESALRRQKLSIQKSPEVQV